MSSCNNPIKQLTTLAKLHHKVHSSVILISILQANDIRVGREVAHDINLAADVLNVHRRPKLLLRYRFTSEDLAGGVISAEVGHAKLATAKFLAEMVPGGDVIAGGGLEDGDLRYVGSRGRATVVVDGEAVLLQLKAILGLRFRLRWSRGRPNAAVPHFWSLGSRIVED